jgi:magnesium transporter
MVLNLEQIKAIITAHEVLLLNSRDPSVIPFVDELHARIIDHHSTATTDHSQVISDLFYFTNSERKKHRSL